MTQRRDSIDAKRWVCASLDPTYAAALLPGNRLHLAEGPIDLIIWADGERSAVADAYRVAERRFDGLLAELVAELPLLRAPLSEEFPPVQGPIASAWHRPAGRTAPSSSRRWRPSPAPWPRQFWPP